MCIAFFSIILWAVDWCVSVFSNNVLSRLKRLLSVTFMRTVISLQQNRNIPVVIKLTEEILQVKQNLNFYLLKYFGKLLDVGKNMWNCARCWEKDMSLSFSVALGLLQVLRPKIFSRFGQFSLLFIGSQPKVETQSACKQHCCARQRRGILHTSIFNAWSSGYFGESNARVV